MSERDDRASEARRLRWERLTSHQHDDVDFLYVVYGVPVLGIWFVVGREG